MEVLLYTVLSGATVYILFILVIRTLTGRKLARHQKEWNERKQKCIAEGMDYWIVKDEYIRYTHDLYVTEINSFLGCCFPRF